MEYLVNSPTLQLTLMILVVMFLDIIIGEFPNRFHVLVYFGKWARFIERVCRKVIGNGIFSGLIAFLITLLIPILGFYFLYNLFLKELNLLYQIGISGVIIYFTIALRSLLEHSKRVRVPLLKGDLKAARFQLSMIVTRDTSNLDESEIVRGGIESISENFIDAVSSTIFWAVLGFIVYSFQGAIIGAMLLRMSNTLDAMWGYKCEKYLYFGRVAARFDDFMHFFSARISYFVISLSGIFLGKSITKGLKVGYKHRKEHASINSNYAMATFAGVLDITLGGLTLYHDGNESYSFWGTGRKVLNAKDLILAEKLTIISTILFILIMIGVFFIWQRLCI